jgi:molybdate transport system substrate-binding protein
LLGLLAAFPVSAAELRVAAASSMQDVMASLASAFERQHGVRITSTFGSSARLYHQILRGAPYDVFMSADEIFPEKLEAEGKGSLRRRYAKGRLVLWASRRSPVDPTRGLDVLSEPRVRKVAIANPKLAPYGHAAQAALQTSKAADLVASKLVYGESAAQAAHFVSTGGAEVGVLPLSIARSPRLTEQGRFWLLPEKLHPPLIAEALVLEDAREKPEAKAFLDFCALPEGQAILRRFGLEPPP